MKNIIHIINFCAFLFFSLNIRCETIVIEGQSTLDSGSIGVAKSQALRDAERRALQQSGSQFEGFTSSGNNGTYSSAHMRVEGAAGNSRILNEASDGSSYRIKAEVNINHDGCKKLSYKKKIAVTAFPVLHLDQVTDLKDIKIGFPLELINELEKTGKFIIRSAVSTSIYENPTLAPELNRLRDSSSLMTFAENIDAQVIIAGVISDMRYLEVQDYTPWNILYEVFDIPPLKRKFMMDLFIYDGITGTLLDTISYEDSKIGVDVFYKGNTSFRSNNFLSSSYGEMIKNIIKKQADDIWLKVSCLPLYEKIVDIKASKIYISAGVNSNISVGDSFIVYHGQDTFSNEVYQNGRSIGYAEEPRATLTITQVQPNFSIGYIDVPIQNIKIGDTIRPW